MDINQVTLVGRLADNVQFKEGKDGKANRAVGRLMINRPPNKEGVRVADAIQVVAWGKNADIMAQYTSRGKEIGVSGSIRVNSVPPKKEGGQWENYFEVMVREIQLGRDSSQGKLMKAAQSGGITPANLDLLAPLLSDPRLMEALDKLSQAARPAATPAAPHPDAAEPTAELVQGEAGADNDPFSNP